MEMVSASPGNLFEAEKRCFLLKHAALNEEF
jgi:hypothetical protein